MQTFNEYSCAAWLRFERCYGLWRFMLAHMQACFLSSELKLELEHEHAGGWQSVSCFVGHTKHMAIKLIIICA